MRLKQRDIDAIKTAAGEVFGSAVVIRLFGSRVDDDARGGDIDLHIEVDDGEQDVEHAAHFRWRLFDLIDPQKIDLVFRVREQPLRPIDRVAYEEGIVL